MRIFKVGDRVKFSEKMNGNLHNPFVKKDNEVRKIVSIFLGNIVLENLPNNSFQADELISAKFEKCDIKNFDICTDREGCKSIYYNGELYGETIGLDILEDNLKDEDEDTANDIIKVERPIKYETIFERNDEIKEMTMKELCEHFGCEVKIIKEEEYNG